MSESQGVLDYRAGRAWLISAGCCAFNTQEKPRPTGVAGGIDGIWVENSAETACRIIMTGNDCPKKSPDRSQVTHSITLARLVSAGHARGERSYTAFTASAPENADHMCRFSGSRSTAHPHRKCRRPSGRKS
jgi:hypothetical protein